MITNNQNREFVHILEHNGPNLWTGGRFTKCYFEGSKLSITETPELRSSVRDAEIINCRQQGCSMGPAIIEDVFVDGLRGSMFQTWGAVFKHVTLKGKIDRVMCSHFVEPAQMHSQMQRSFDAANKAYYAQVDWALDISEAEFLDADFRGVPSHLIRRDPETQVVVKREKALEGEWKRLNLPRLWQTWISQMLEFKEPDTVLVAAKRDKNLKEQVQGLRLLQHAGVAEPE